MILSIDPGCSATGVALLDEKGNPQKLWTIRPKGKTIDDKIRDFVYHFVKLNKEFNLCSYKIFVIEEPNIGWTRAGKNHKDLMKLQRFITRLVQHFAYWHFKILYVDADEISKGPTRNWDKEQDAIVKLELKEAGFKRTSVHARDAVRIGRFWLGQQRIKGT